MDESIVYTLVREIVVSFLIKERFLISRRRSSASQISTSSWCRGYMIIRRPEGAGWYDLVLLKNNIEEGADSEEEQWVTGSESESDTDDSDLEDGQDNF